MANQIGGHISVPKGRVPVYATFDGERVKIGEGYIDPRSGVFTTEFNDEPKAQALYHNLVNAQDYHMAVRVSEVEAFKEAEPVGSGDESESEHDEAP